LDASDFIAKDEAGIFYASGAKTPGSEESGVGFWGMDVMFRESGQGDAARAGRSPCCFKLLRTCRASSLD